jgi:hypothetical protein
VLDKRSHFDCKSKGKQGSTVTRLQGDAMKEICEFEINNNIYKIYNVNKITGKENYVGRSHYEDKTIYIEER